MRRGVGKTMLAPQGREQRRSGVISKPTMLPYGLMTLVAAFALAVHHVVITDASRLSKLAVSLAVVVSLAIWWNCWQWQWRVVLIVLTAAVSVYTLTYLKLAARDA